METRVEAQQNDRELHAIEREIRVQAAVQWLGQGRQWAELFQEQRWQRVSRDWDAYEAQQAEQRQREEAQAWALREVSGE